MRFNVIGFFVGAICAIVLFVVGTDLTAFRHEGLVWGLAALLLWGYLTFNWPGSNLRA